MASGVDGHTLPPVSYNFSSDATEETLPVQLAALAENGARRIALEARQLMQAADSPAWRKALQTALRDNGLGLFDAHAPHSACHSLGHPIATDETLFWTMAEKAMDTAAELEIRTLTFHCARTRRMGTMALDDGSTIPHADLDAAKARILRQLDRLVPEAEKRGLVIALENLFLPTSSAAFLTSILADFPDSPNLGLNYDSGHALLLERQPGKRSADIAEWIRCGWDDDTVLFQDDQLDMMLPFVVTTHLHDNHGVNDEHLLPGQGIADWPRIVERLRHAPRLLSIQSEVSAKHFPDGPASLLPAFAAIGLMR